MVRLPKSVAFAGLLWPLTLQLLGLLIHPPSQSAVSHAYSSSSVWPLQYHNSPWLHRDFIERPENEPTSEPEPPATRCDENKDMMEDGGAVTPSTCQTKDECAFTPSAHCVIKWNKRQAEIKEDPGLDLDTLLEKLAKRSTTTLRMDAFAANSDAEWPVFERCDFLTEKIIDEMCTIDRRNIRQKVIHNLSLRSCRRFALDRALETHLYALVINSTASDACSKILRELLVLDDLVEQLACEYESILTRYDCKAKWSRWECHDCRLAYRDWLCSTFIPYHTNGVLIKPCQSICEQVEQKCPHLHPYGKGQYAGEPVFLCIDPNIPFNEQITPDTPYGTEDWCYNLCDLEKCQNDDGERPKLSCWMNEAQVEMTSANSTELTDNVTVINVSTENGFPTIGTDDSLLTTVGHETLDSEVHTAKSGETTLSPADLSESYLDEITSGKVSSTTTFGWDTDDQDFYLVQASADGVSKQSQSGQYIELEPNYDGGKKETMFAMDTYDVTESTVSSNYQASLQDIYRDAMSVTTVDSLGNDSPDKADMLLNEELTQDEWINPVNIPPTTLTPSPYEPYSELTTAATGTESTRKVTTTPKPSRSGKGKSPAKGGSDTGAANRFRHHNSRSKEQLKNVAEHRTLAEKAAKGHGKHGKESAKLEQHTTAAIPTAQRLQQQTRPTRQPGTSKAPKSERPVLAQATSSGFSCGLANAAIAALIIGTLWQVIG